MTEAPPRPTAHPNRAKLALGVGVVAVVTAALTAWFTGASAALQLADPGAFTRWTIPTLRAVHDVAAALTIGLLLLGGFIVAEGPTSRRRYRTATYATWTALVWGVAGVIGVVLGYSDVAGEAVGAPGFWSGVWQSTWDLEILRAPAITALIALAVATSCYFKPGRNAQAWLCVLSVGALLPLALIGHSAGSADHETAVNSLAVHLISVTLWVGGLLALAMVWSRLGKSAATSVARFSRLATWCYVGVGVSGVLNAWIRLAGWSGLDSRYGVIVLAKAAALVVLGVFGYRQRGAVVARLASQPDDIPGKALFARLAGAEVLVMGIAIGLATALSRSQPPAGEPTATGDEALALTGYPTPPRLTSTSWLTQFSFDWLFGSIALVAIGLYVAWVIRLARRGDSWPWTRTACWVLGWVVFIYATGGAPRIYGRVMFSAHMLEHMTVAMFVPILLVRGGFVTLALRALPKRSDATLGPREVILQVVHSRFTQVMANPVVAAAFFFISMTVFYYSPLFELALTTHTGHVLMTVHFLLSGYLYAWALIGIDPGPKKWAPQARLIVLLVTIAFHAFFGVALMTGTTLLAPDFFTSLHLPWVTSPIRDQQSGGTIAWGAGELPTFMLVMFLAGEWYRRDRAQAVREERNAERTDDADLKAYNAYLESLRGRR